MKIAYTAYKALSSTLFLTFFPPFWLYSRISGKHRDSMPQRLGIYPDRLIQGISGAPRIWMHAVSLGEVRVALAIIHSIRRILPEASLILSTGTEPGQASAKQHAGDEIRCVYAPFDFILSVRKAIAALRPDVLACVETEIWPNWLMEAHRMGVKTALVNGRISVRSIRRYLKIRPLMRETLGHVDALSMMGRADAERILKMGAPEDRTVVGGNAKYDLLLQQTDAGLAAAMARRYNLDGSRPVFVAGSVRGGEVHIVLDVYGKIIQAHPDTLLIIAPRHVKRVPHIVSQLTERGWKFALRTQLDGNAPMRTAPVVVLDTIGELHATYSLASVVFCGSSLVALGGQNVFEAAVWAKPVLYGPSMEDFMDAKHLLESTRGGIQVKDGPDLAEKLLHLLSRPHEAEAMGKRAYQAVCAHQGAARKHAEVICRLLGV